MNILRLGNDGFLALLWIDGAIAAVLLVLLLTTVSARHLVMAQRFYFSAALVGFLAWLIFVVSSGEVFHSGSPKFVQISIFIVTSLPYILLVEVAALCWLGVHKP